MLRVSFSFQSLQRFTEPKEHWIAPAYRFQSRIWLMANSCSLNRLTVQRTVLSGLDTFFSLDRNPCFMSAPVFSQVGESDFQSGNLNSPFMKTCRNLFLGSNHYDHSFRGHIGGVVLWGYSRSQEDLLKRPLETDKSETVLAMWADFINVMYMLFFSLPAYFSWKQKAAKLLLLSSTS